MNDLSPAPPGRTRVERRRPVPARHILVLKLDHLGDFIMGIPAMERLRGHFPKARITLVCGSWNVASADALGLFDCVLALDAFPLHASDGTWPDPAMLMTKLSHMIATPVDLAIDLRVDGDTRAYLQAVPARFRAGIGTASRFGCLDVFLPIDATRPQPPPPSVLTAERFRAGALCRHQGYAIGFAGRVGAPEILVFGPYLELPSGRYRFRPFLEVAAGSVGYDILIDDAPVARGRLVAEETITFHNPAPSGHFQFRLILSATDPSCAFRFFGGEVLRAPVSDGLHQSEYLALLVELVALRVQAGLLLPDDRTVLCPM